MQGLKVLSHADLKHKDAGAMRDVNMDLIEDGMREDGSVGGWECGRMGV